MIPSKQLIDNTPALAGTIFREGFYLTYPHNNGFCKDGRSLVLGRLDGVNTSLWKTSLDSEDQTRICDFDASCEMESRLWFDVARKANRLVMVRDNGIWIYDLEKEGRAERIYQAESPALLVSLPNITSDGRQVIVGLHFPDRYAALRVYVESGGNRVRFEHAWLTKHYHFSPHDEAWIGFCHEGSCDQVNDRVWAWHAVHAPEGRCLMNQNWDNSMRALYVGHERWCFHAPTALAVAYGVSPGEMRGIYEVGRDGRPARLVSQGDRCWHVNASPSGRWAVIDTSGAHDLPGKGWENAGDISDILLLDMVTGEQRWLARSRLGKTHPSHPHPTFSPDEKFVLFNEAIGRSNRVRLVENPWLANDPSLSKHSL